jgi:hypothetical protein
MLESGHRGHGREEQHNTPKAARVGLLASPTDHWWRLGFWGENEEEGEKRAHEWVVARANPASEGLSHDQRGPYPAAKGVLSTVALNKMRYEMTNLP